MYERKSKDVTWGLPKKDTGFDYYIDLRLHIRADSIEEAIQKADKLSDTVTRKVNWAWLVVQRWKEPKGKSKSKEL